MAEVMLTLGTKRKIDYELAEAKEVIAGYAFGREKLQWTAEKPIPDWAGKPLPADLERFVFSYMTYDNIRPLPGAIRVEEVLLTAGVESQISSRGANAVMAMCDLITPDLVALGAGRKFWEMNGPLLAMPPPAGGPEHHLWRAWKLLEAPKWSGPAVAHKILHHKLPGHVPLVDSKIVAIYGVKDTWLGIWRDLNDHAEDFAYLEEWFAGLAGSRGCEPLTRLRLIDILLWTDQSATKDKEPNRKIAQRLGETLLSQRN